VQLAPVALSWEPAQAFSSWVPDYMPADATFGGTYRSAAATQPVALNILYYRNQRRDKALISSVNKPAAERNAYAPTASALRTEQPGGRNFVVRETTLRSASGPILVWQWIWIDQRATANDYVGKIWQAQAKLAFRPDDGAAVMLSAPFSENPQEARAALRAFLAANLAPIETALATTRGR
jgi:EpsI family protein